MPPTVSPRGPLPARVYWARRLVVLGVPLVLVVVLARVLGGSADGTDAAGNGVATQSSAQVTDPVEAPVAGPTARAGPKNKKNKKKKDIPVVPAEPVLAEPSGPCTDSDIVVTPTLTSAPGGSDVPITINLRTVVSEACTWQVSPQTMTLTITSGNDFIWSTRECPAAIPVQDVVVRQAVDTPVVATWKDGRRSDETCSGATEWARPGFYHVEAAALGGEATDVQFELTVPTAGVVTQTAEPEQQGGKGRKNGGSDDSHVPGEDGAGNSVG